MILFIAYMQEIRDEKEVSDKLKDLKTAKEELNCLRQDIRRRKNAKLLISIKKNGGVSSREFWQAAKGEDSLTQINTLRKKDGSQTDSVESTVKRAAEHFNDLLKARLKSLGRNKTPKSKINHKM